MYIINNPVLLTSALSLVSLASFLQFVPYYLEMFASIDKQKDYVRFYSSAAEESATGQVFDFIIVGGGSAGSVVANRLSAHPDYRVLVLEAGGDPSPFMAIPYMQGNIVGSSYDYQYTTVPQERANLAMVDQKMKLPFGKALGGTSNLNNMMYMRGSPKDYDHWAKITGDHDWSYDNVLPYFKKSEDYHGNFPTGTVHNVGGPLYVGKLGFELPSAPTFFAASMEKGYPETDLNSNSSNLEGFMHADVHIKNGARWGSYQAFLEPVLSRPNLHIYRYSRVTKIHVDGDNRAFGVTYMRHGQTQFVAASKEVIVSAGPIDSPKLLLLSGIGPSAELSSLGITPIVDLPAVGSNMQDHVATSIGPILLNEAGSSFITNRDLNVDALTAYISNGTGPLSSTQFRVALGYSVSQEFNDKAWPDIYCIVSGRGIDAQYGAGVGKGLGGKDNAFESYFEPWVGRDAHQIRVILARPKSTGRVSLSSADPSVMPLIDPNYYADPSDVTRMVEGIRFILDLYENTTTFKALNASLASNSFPGCESLEFRSDEYWTCYIQHFTMTMSHHCGTCRMGNNDTETSVVDSHLRVLKTKSLRVIDASVMPEVIIGNTNAPTVMIGEKGADYILQEWMTSNG